MAALRRRRGAAAPPRRRQPLPDALRRASYDLDRMVGRVHRLTDDDRFARLAKSGTLDASRRDLRLARDRLDEALARWPE